jgi:hypothetical protein
MSELKVDKVSPRTGNYVALNTVGSKNIIINGDMSIAQRGTSTSSITGSGYFTCDRFAQTTLNNSTWTQSQSTDVPSGQGFANSLKLNCTTVSIDSTGGFLYFGQRFEGQNLQYLKFGTANAESLTLSFWVKSNKTGIYTVEFQNTSGTDRINCQEYTISSANTWEKKIITIPGDTVSTIDNDNSSSFWLSWWLAAGTNFTSGTLQTSWGNEVTANRASSSNVNLGDNTANEWYITGVQLEAGTTASDFEFLPYDVNLQRCERYYQLFNYISGSVICMGNSETSTGATGGFDFNTMRAAPTVTLPTAGQTANTASFLTAGGAYPSTTGSFSANSIGIKNFRIRGTSYVGLSSAKVSWLYSTGNTSLTLDAEL